MTITDSVTRTHFITGLIRALVRHRLEDTIALLSVDEIDAKTTNADRAFMLRLLRTAEPLYPTSSVIIDFEDDTK